LFGLKAERIRNLDLIFPSSPFGVATRVSSLVAKQAKDFPRCIASRAFRIFGIGQWTQFHTRMEPKVFALACTALLVLGVATLVFFVLGTCLEKKWEQNVDGGTGCIKATPRRS